MPSLTWLVIDGAVLGSGAMLKHGVLGEFDRCPAPPWVRTDRLPVPAIRAVHKGDAPEAAWTTV